MIELGKKIALQPSASVPLKVIGAARKEKNPMWPKLLIAVGLLLPIVLDFLTPSIVPLFLVQETQLNVYLLVGVVLALLGVYLTAFFAIAAIKEKAKRDAAFELILLCFATPVAALFFSFFMPLTFPFILVVVSLWRINSLIEKIKADNKK